MKTALKILSILHRSGKCFNVVNFASAAVGAASYAALSESQIVSDMTVRIITLWRASLSRPADWTARMGGEEGCSSVWWV
jgi:hypothetical protein